MLKYYVLGIERGKLIRITTESPQNLVSSNSNSNNFELHLYFSHFSNILNPITVVIGLWGVIVAITFYLSYLD